MILSLRKRLIFFYPLYIFVLAIPSYAVTVRRLHDIGKSGWMIFVTMILAIGVIWLLILLITGSNPKENQYGLNLNSPNLNGPNPYEPNPNRDETEKY